MTRIERIEMKKTVLNKKIYRIALLLILGISLTERVYNKTAVSGKYSVYISVLLVLISFVFDILHDGIKYKLNKKILFLLPIALYFPCAESIRYTIFFALIILWNKYLIEDLHIFCMVMILTGAVFSIRQYLEGASRISGFIYSPTLYSCLLVIFNTYLLFEKKRSMLGYMSVGLSTIMIYMTGSSSGFVCNLGIIIYKVVINIFLSHRDKITQIKKNKRRIITVCLIVALGLSGAYIIFNLNDVLSIIKRDNRNASTMTRTKYLAYFINDLFSDIKIFLIGHGGGYTQKYFRSAIGIGQFYPLHQDIIMFLVEYGVLGCIYIYKHFLSRLNFTWIIYLVLVLCSFHNIVLASQIMILLILVSNSLNKQYGQNRIWF